MNTKTDFYKKEAEIFQSTMSNMLPDILLDYSPESLGYLENFIIGEFDSGKSQFNQTLATGLGCYLGEVIIRNLGGQWNAEGKPEINKIGQIVAVFPIDKAIKRFKFGPQESLTFYYQTILRHKG